MAQSLCGTAGVRNSLPYFTADASLRKRPGYRRWDLLVLDLAGGWLLGGACTQQWHRSA